MNKKYFNIFKNTNGWQKFFIGTGVIVIFALFLAGSIGLIDTMSSSSYGGNIFSRKDECKDSAYYDSSSYSTEKDLKRDRKCLNKLKKEFKKKKYI